MKIVHWFDIVLFVRRYVRLSEIRLGDHRSQRTQQEDAMKLRPETDPEHWPGALHCVSHSAALHLRDATGTRFWFTPERYGFVRCYWCGDAKTREQMTKDHVIARCFGGRDVLENIVPACAPCNTARSHEQARLMEALRIEWTNAELRTIERRQRPNKTRRKHRRGVLGRHRKRQRSRSPI